VSSFVSVILSVVVCCQLTSWAFIACADAKGAGLLSNDLVNQSALGDKKCPQGLGIATETVSNFNGKSTGNNNEAEATTHKTEIKQHANNEDKDLNFFSQRNNDRNNNQQKTGSRNNSSNHQQNDNDITCHACNQRGHMSRNCSLLKRIDDGHQNNDRQVHFEQV